MDRGPKRGLTVHTLEKSLHHPNPESMALRTTPSVGGNRTGKPCCRWPKSGGSLHLKPRSDTVVASHPSLHNWQLATPCLHALGLCHDTLTPAITPCLHWLGLCHDTTAAGNTMSALVWAVSQHNWHQQENHDCVGLDCVTTHWHK